MADTKPIADHPLAELLREVEQLKTAQQILGDRIEAIEKRLITWSEISEESGQH